MALPREKQGSKPPGSHKPAPGQFAPSQPQIQPPGSLGPRRRVLAEEPDGCGLEVVGNHLKSTFGNHAPAALGFKVQLVDLEGRLRSRGQPSQFAVRGGPEDDAVTVQLKVDRHDVLTRLAVEAHSANAPVLDQSSALLNP